MMVSAIACGILGIITAYAIYKWRAESKLVGELRSDIDYLYGIIDNMQYDLDIERDKTVTREHIINNRDAEIKDLQDRLDDALRQIADWEAKAVKPKPVKTVKPLYGYVRCPKCFGLGVVPKYETQPQPEYRCLKCKRFVKAGVTYCDRCFDKIARIKEAGK